MIDRLLDEPVIPDLRCLPTLAMDPRRAARVRMRCRVHLARRARISEPPPPFARRVLAPAVVLGACGIYVYALVSTVVRLTGSH